MAKNPQQKDEALEALDFIVNVLKEHERDLDRLINELATVSEQIGDTGELTGKLEKVEEKISNLQKEVTTLIGNVLNSKAAAPNVVTQVAQAAPALANAEVASVSAAASAGPSVVLRCKQWEDFQALALHAQTVSFAYKEDQKVFQADALKGNQVITYSGPMPKFSVIMKAFLARQLDVSERCILEGVLALG